MCHAGAMVAPWAITQEVAGSSPFNDKYFLSLNSVEKMGKTPLFWMMIYLSTVLNDDLFVEE